MSWWVHLEDANGTVGVPAHSEGGTYVVGGVPSAELNVTYNYGKHFRFNELDGKVASDTISALEDAMERLGVERSNNYWEPTKGNVGYAVSILLGWARANPTAKWRVS